MSFNVRTGIWTDYSKGSIVGTTLTLSARDGALLLAFIAAFVTVVSSQLWKIIGFVAHQVRASPGPHDGLHFQTQVVLRNASSPFGAAWLFLQQTWSWRHRVPAWYTRTLIWAVFSVLYLVTFAVLAIFSSQVSKAASEIRLIAGAQCGYWEPIAPATTADLTLGTRALASKLAFDTASASRYARACYSANTSSPECGILPTASLQWKGYNDTKCPFDDGETCEQGQAIGMVAGPIDSQTDLGINTPNEHRLTLYRNATCAPIPTSPFATYESFSGNDTTADAEYGRWTYNYGPDLSTSTRTNYTFRYNTAAQAFDFGYTVVSKQNEAGQGENNSWVPASALQVDNADISLYFVLFNSVHFLEPCDDVVFAAHSAFDGFTYAADRPVSVISCIEQSQICNPVNNRCTPYHGRQQMTLTDLVTDINLHAQQIATLERIDWALRQSSIYDAVSYRDVGNLRAADTMISSAIQLGLPSNQWQLEVTGWFEESLAKLQHQVQEYATGPTIQIEGGEVLQLWTNKGDNVTDDKAIQAWGQMEKDQCRNQVTRDTQGTISFSVLGLSIIFAIGGLIILLSLTIVPVVAWLQGRFNFGEYKRRTWILDEMLQLQRLLLSELDLGVWSGSAGLVPITLTQDKIEFGTRRGNDTTEQVATATTEPKKA